MCKVELCAGINIQITEANKNKKQTASLKVCKAAERIAKFVKIFRSSALRLKNLHKTSFESFEI